MDKKREVTIRMISGDEININGITGNKIMDCIKSHKPLILSKSILISQHIESIKVRNDSKVKIGKDGVKYIDLN